MELKNKGLKMQKMSVTRGLRELKLIDARIGSAISKLNALDVSQEKYKGKALRSNMDIKEFESTAQSRYDAVVGLQKRRASIKTAIMISNLKTKVKVGSGKGVKAISVAEAIEYKNQVKYEKELLLTLKKQKQQNDKLIAEAREELDEKIDAMVSQNLGSDSKNKTQEVENISNAFVKANELRVIDPLKIEAKIKTLEEKIDTFESEVDIVLSESNSKTEIEVEEDVTL
jgi:hypothetical protein